MKKLTILLIFLGLSLSTHSLQAMKKRNIRRNNNIKQRVFRVVKNGNLKRTKTLVSKRPNFINARDNQNRTLLHWAARNGRLKIARFLITSGADVKTTDKNQQTPLHLAAQFGRPLLVELLLKNGASINALNDQNQTPFALTIQAQNVKKGERCAFSLLKLSVMYIEDEEDGCPICLEDYEDEKCTILGCNHIFHVSCIQDWKTRSNTCPICNANIVVSKPFEFEDVKKKDENNSNDG